MKAPPLSWNRYPKISPASIHRLHDRSAPLPSSNTALLAYANGRSYGDVCLNEDGTLLLTRGLDRFIAFDPYAGILRCEAGITLAEILELITPQGWFLACTPGTQYVTLGGALANDVHGKNHHFAGSFGHHVCRFELTRSDGERLECSAQQNADYFHATIGGLGLTGLISWVEIQLIRINNPWMRVEAQRFQNLEEFWQINQQAETRWPYTVAWIDCLAKGKARGRGIYYAGCHAPVTAQLPLYRQRSKQVPFTPPFSLINRLSLRAFNSSYYHQPIRSAGSLSHYAPYFYPLDAIKQWNRIYGRQGFYQYQCVLPPTEAKEGSNALLECIAASGQGSFLAVLKTFGDMAPAGMLSFPRRGATLALDFPNLGTPTLRLLTSLDSIVREAGGAIYPAKDARMPGELFRSGFPQWEQFSNFIDPSFSSSFWRRVTQ